MDKGNYRDKPTTNRSRRGRYVRKDRVEGTQVLEERPDNLLKKYGWRLDDYMDEEAIIERWRFTEDGKDTFAYCDGEVFWVQSEWKAFKPGTNYTLAALKAALEGSKSESDEPQIEVDQNDTGIPRRPGTQQDRHGNPVRRQDPLDYWEQEDDGAKTKVNQCSVLSTGRRFAARP